MYDNTSFFNFVEDELKECGSVRITVKGFSMQPVIRNGRDSVILDKYDGHRLHHGDICLFRYRGSHILHRYKGDEGEHMVMQGDNVLLSCEYCKIEDVVAVVRTIYHNGVETSPNSKKWYVITKIHRGCVRFRMSVGRFLRFIGLKKK